MYESDYMKSKKSHRNKIKSFRVRVHDSSDPPKVPPKPAAWLNKPPGGKLSSHKDLEK